LRGPTASGWRRSWRVEVVHQKKLSSIVTMSPGSTVAFRSTCGDLLGIVVPDDVDLVREARSLKPPRA
jgi:hypothetical protein